DRTNRDPQASGRRHPDVLRKRFEISGAVSVLKLLLSWVRDFVDVKASAEDIAETLALRGFEVASLETVGGNDAVIDFEVTANRPDCLSVLGFAREIGTAYDLPVRLPSVDPKAKLGLAKIDSGESDHLKVSLE